MKIHLLGIGGTGMGSLAGLLCEAGHTVTGTDEKLYPPMSLEIEKLKVTAFEGYRAENIAAVSPDMVIIGNVIRRENPEAQEVMRLGLSYRSMPEALSEIFLKKRTPVVITGTHGKTTAATLAAWLLESCGERPGFLIGGVGLNFEKSYEIGKGPFFVVEGDEYDTAFFDKGPKFLHYRPRALVITSIEFDHADIYRNLGQIMESFRRLVKIVPPDGLIVANADDKNVEEIAMLAKCRVVRYGMKNGDFVPKGVAVGERGTSFTLAGTQFTIPMWGVHNLSNATGVLALLIESGCPKEKLAEGVFGFKGVRRRQEVVTDEKGVVIIDDFAHHPTAVLKTIESMRFRFPKRRLWAIFEPRSNTSRRNIFQGEFASALGTADRVIVANPYRSESIAQDERFDPAGVARTLTQNGVDAHNIADTGHIVEFVMRNINSGDVILVMSNGGFDGMTVKLANALKKRNIQADNK